MSVIDNAEKRINSIMDQISGEYPAYSVISYLLDFNPSFIISTAGVNEYGKGLYNPEFIQTLTDLQLKFVIMHEASHVILKHLFRYKKMVGISNVKEADPNDFRIFNCAADVLVNSALEDLLPIGSVPAGAWTPAYATTVIDKNATEIKNMNTEEIYLELKHAVNKNKKELEENDYFDLFGNSSASNQGGAGGNASGGNGNQNKDETDESESQGSGDKSSDDSNKSDNTPSDNNQKNSGSGDGPGIGNYKENTEQSPVNDDQKSIQDAIDEYYNLSDSEKVDLAQKIKKAIDQSQENQKNLTDRKILTEVQIVDFNWKSALLNFVSKIAGRIEIERSWKKPSRRYMNIMPYSKGRTRRKSQKDVTFAVDVSGSMDEDKIVKSANLLYTYAMKNNLNMKFYFWSHEYTDIYEYTSMEDFVKKLHNHSGGGTAAEACFRNFDNSEVGEGIVVLTDCEFNIDERMYNRFGKPMMVIDIDPGSYKPTEEFFKSKDSYCEFK